MSNAQFFWDLDRHVVWAQAHGIDSIVFILWRCVCVYSKLTSPAKFMIEKNRAKHCINESADLSCAGACADRQNSQRAIKTYLYDFELHRVFALSVSRMIV